MCLTCCVCFEGIDFCLESSDGSRLTADGVTEAVNPAVSAADVIAQVIVPAREIVVAILIDHCTHQVWPLAKIFLAFEYFFFKIKDMDISLNLRANHVRPTNQT